AWRCTRVAAARRGPFTFSALTWSVATRPRAARMPASGVNLGPRGFGGVGKLVDLMRMRDGLARGIVVGEELELLGFVLGHRRHRQVGVVVAIRVPLQAAV